MSRISVAIFGLLLLIVSGCESGQAARNMARISLGTTVSYEQEVDAKIAAENQYYQQSVANLEKSTKKQAGLSEQVEIDSRQPCVELSGAVRRQSKLGCGERPTIIR
jgi:hypothetical protein